MKVIHIDYKNISAKVENLSLILGYFDGVHLGHRYLIKRARKISKYPLAILTFDKPVSSLINNGKKSELITSLDDRFKMISKLGIDFYYVFHIDLEFLNLSAEAFIDLLKRMNVKEVFVGEDFHFGKGKTGNINLLKDYFNVEVVDLLTDNGEKISSIKIKELIQKGYIEKANKLLGHSYQINGTPVKGKGIGRTINFPTINIKLNENYILPKYGVYKTITYLDGIPHLSITNVGVNPTITEDNSPTIEVHLKDYLNVNFSVVSVEFLNFLRPEKKFSSLDELKAQIELDVKKVFKN